MSGFGLAAGGKGKPVSQWHLCQLSALLKAHQCVCVSREESPTIGRLVTNKGSGSQGGGVECNEWHYLLMPAANARRPQHNPSLTVDIALGFGHQVEYFWLTRGLTSREKERG